MIELNHDIFTSLIIKSYCQMIRPGIGNCALQVYETHIIHSFNVHIIITTLSMLAIKCGLLIDVVPGRE